MLFEISKGSKYFCVAARTGATHTHTRSVMYTSYIYDVTAVYGIPYVTPGG